MFVSQVLRRNLASGHAAVWAGIPLVSGFAWFLLMQMNIGVDALYCGSAPFDDGLSGLATNLSMWVLMMAAMMLPTTLPAVSAFGMLASRRSPGIRGRMTAMFVSGYAIAWLGYCVPASVAQFELTRLALLSPIGRTASALAGAAILTAAGLFQFSAMKLACLGKCRTPLAFLMHSWRDGSAGALSVGIRHGAYCVGCCWALMAVMFAVGTMNLAWMALLTVLMLAEKVAPQRWRFDRVLGVLLITCGAVGTVTSLA